MNSRIFQHNTFTTLSSGFYKGTITLKEALEHGSVGIGTLDTANGEVTIINGIAYHGDSENHVRLDNALCGNGRTSANRKIY